MDNEPHLRDHATLGEKPADARSRLESVSVRGFRSLADVELTDLGDVTVLIGANGSGKSNVIRFFEMLSWMVRSRKLEEFVARHGGADDQLFMGNKVTPRMEADISLRSQSGVNEYSFALSHGSPDRFVFTEEQLRFSRNDWEGEAEPRSLGSGHTESRIHSAAQGDFSEINKTTARVIRHLLQDCGTFQFHDTSASAKMKQNWEVSENRSLRSDGGNLGPVLMRLEVDYPDRLDWIQENIRRVLPSFDSFVLEDRHGRVLLRWRGTVSDKTFGAHLTSDGSLRFFALVTLLNLPPEMLPSVALIDEPELGLHPSAVTLVGSMIDSLASQCQVIVATQSPQLVNCFGLDDIAVMELENSRTVVHRKSQDEYEQWLDEDYTTGDLWQMNLLGGRP
ncbi:MAG: AAA family ATPase [Acidimicrobiaceae bacterium]|nr:AAA family ATPase [Acidimicrobiaceae bacterium]MXW76668.1 AAA family ATPase [Acidimicrobiaceae bacterium]MYC43076.1 AAA family ATPase [Acidimicrobiaceae bacterium]MYD08242.1 AAA family ATPase [Acidimicrobiaceae bacterium]